jgi:hypothetical protein
LIAIRLARDKRLGLPHAALGSFLFISLVAYLVLPPDWMGEYRFATLFFLFFCWILGELGIAAAPPDVARFSATVLAAALVLETTPSFASRSASFAESPTVPFERIVAFARGYETLARRLERPDPSLLTPDLGGMLYSTNLAVHDLAGLCDSTIAHTLTRDRAAFHDYVFDRLAPTLIHVHASWAGWAGLHDDPRFMRDYAALHEQWERPAGREREDNGQEPWVGDYVRRDAVASRERLEQLRRTFRELGLDRPLP